MDLSAGTFIYLFIEDALRKGYKTAVIRTVDTNVVVLAIAFASRGNISELWIAFDSGKSFHYIPALAHDIGRIFGPGRWKTLPMFHAFT